MIEGQTHLPREIKIFYKGQLKDITTFKSIYEC